MEFNFDVINILVLITTIANMVYGLVVFSQDRKDATHVAFFCLVAGVGAWGIGMLAFRGWFPGLDLVVGARLLYATAAIIPFASLYFAYVFPEREITLSLWQKVLIPIPFFATLALSLWENGLIVDAARSAGENLIHFNLWAHILYVAYIFLYFGTVFLILVTRYRAADGALRKQLAFIIAGTLTTTSIALITNLLLPFFEIFSYNWLGQVGVIAMISGITYAILKHHLFNAKIIATELFIFFLWIFILVRTLLADSLEERVANLALFGATVFIGLLLIRSVIREVETREKIETLAKDLEKANARLKELDRQKTEFVSIASHQLRSPLTAIKGYSSLLLEGSYGKLSKAAAESIKKIFDSSKYMAISIEDFLNVSRIELGTVKYDMKDFSFATLGEEIVGELLPAADERNLKLTFKDESNGLAVIRGDYGKLRQVVLNLVDNAMKYTKEGGITVTISADQTKHVAQLAVADTGVGIPTDVMPKLFGKFVRAKNANEVNVMGTGLGLYVAKQFVEAHHGRIWAESLGQGKGSTFKVELPLKA